MSKVEVGFFILVYVVFNREWKYVKELIRLIICEVEFFFYEL